MLKRCTGSGNCMDNKACHQTVLGRTINCVLLKADCQHQYDCTSVYFTVFCCAIDFILVLNALSGLLDLLVG